MAGDTDGDQQTGPSISETVYDANSSSDPFGIASVISDLLQSSSKGAKADDENDPDFPHLSKSKVLDPRFSGLEGRENQDSNSLSAPYDENSLLGRYVAFLRTNGAGTEEPKPDPQEQAFDILRNISTAVDITSGSAGFVSGPAYLLTGFYEMESFGFHNDDHFFHCRAHCEATAQGLGGALESLAIGFGREMHDLPVNLMSAKYTADYAIRDSVEDIQANFKGDMIGLSYLRRGGPLRCTSTCYDAFPFNMERRR